MSDTAREVLSRSLDSYLTAALSIYDVMKAVPHPYNAVAGMANKWAHDFVGFANSTLAEFDRREAEVESLRAKLAAVEAIHRPKKGENAHGKYTMCVGCSTSTYPCPTIAAIRSQEPPTS